MAAGEPVQWRTYWLIVKLRSWFETETNEERTSTTNREAATALADSGRRRADARSVE